jgi:tetratricopeptide (TPR) repeat protein
VLQGQGDLAGAQGCFERALAIDERVYGLEHPKVAIRVNNLGGVLYNQGDLVGARGYFERALGIFEKFLPEGHPDIAVVRGNLESLGK